MAEEIPHPHDSMVHAVLSDLAEATSFLQRFLPEELSQALNWSTLRWVWLFWNDASTLGFPVS